MKKSTALRLAAINLAVIMLFMVFPVKIWADYGNYYAYSPYSEYNYEKLEYYCGYPDEYEYDEGYAGEFYKSYDYDSEDECKSEDVPDYADEDVLINAFYDMGVSLGVNNFVISEPLIATPGHLTLLQVGTSWGTEAHMGDIHWGSSSIFPNRRAWIHVRGMDGSGNPVSLPDFGERGSIELSRELTHGDIFINDSQGARIIFSSENVARYYEHSERLLITANYTPVGQTIPLTDYISISIVPWDIVARRSLLYVWHTQTGNIVDSLLHPVGGGDNRGGNGARKDVVTVRPGARIQLAHDIVYYDANRRVNTRQDGYVHAFSAAHPNSFSVEQFYWLDNERFYGTAPIIYIDDTNIARTITVVAWCCNKMDDTNCVSSYPLTIHVIGPQTAPAAPTIAVAATPVAVTLAHAEFTDPGGLEFGWRLASSTDAVTNWQPGLEFTGLPPGTVIHFFARRAETPTLDASPMSSFLLVTTLEAALEGNVTISGTPVFGQQLTAAPTLNTNPAGGAVANPIFQWQRGPAASGNNWTNIAGANEAVYTPVLGDIGQYLRVRVTHAGTSAYVASDATAIVTRATITNADLNFSLDNVVFNNAPRAIAVIARPGIGVGAITVEYQHGQTGAWVATAPTNVGTHNVRVQVEQGTTHQGLTDSLLGSFQITRATPVASHLNVTPARPHSMSWAANMTNPFTAVPAGIAENGLGAVTWQFQRHGTSEWIAFAPSMGTGIFTVRANIAQGTNFYAAQIELGNLTITGTNIPTADIIVTPISTIYNAQPHQATVVDAGGGTVTFYLESDRITAVSNPQFTNAGTHRVYFRVRRTGPGNEGWNDYLGSTTVTIARRPLANATVNFAGAVPAFTGAQRTRDITNMTSDIAEHGIVTVPSVNFGDRGLAVSWGANINAGPTAGSVTITAGAASNFVGSVTQNFEIAQATINAIADEIPGGRSFTAYQVRNRTDIAGIATHAGLPANLRVRLNDSAGQIVTLPVTWSSSTPFNAQGVAYVMDANFAGNSNIIGSAINNAVTVTVDSVTAVAPTFGTAFIPLADATNNNPAAGHDDPIVAALLPVSGTWAYGSVSVPYTINWSSTTTINLQNGVAGTYATFTGVVTFTDPPAWLTLPTSVGLNVTRRLEVTEATPVVPVITIPTIRVFDGNASSATETAAGVGADYIVLQWQHGSTGAWVDNAPVNAGNHRVRATINPASTFVGEAIRDFIITQRPLTVTAANLNVTRNAALPSVPAINITGLIAAHEATDVFATQPVAAFTVADSATAGTSPIIFTTLGALNSAAGFGHNYTVTHVSGTLTVTAPVVTPPILPDPPINGNDDGNDDGNDLPPIGGVVTPTPTPPADNNDFPPPLRTVEPELVNPWTGQGHVAPEVERQLGYIEYIDAVVLPVDPHAPGQDNNNVVVLPLDSLNLIYNADVALIIPNEDFSVIFTPEFIIELREWARTSGQTDFTFRVETLETLEEGDGLASVRVTIAQGQGGNRQYFRQFDSPITIAASLYEDLSIDNPYRVTAVRVNGGERIGGAFNPATGLFEFQTLRLSDFVIIYAEELRRLVLYVDSPYLYDLADNAKPQTMEVLPTIFNEGGYVWVPISYIVEALGIYFGEVAEYISEDGLVPLDFLHDFFGAHVTWDEESGRIEIIFDPQRAIEDEESENVQNIFMQPYTVNINFNELTVGDNSPTYRMVDGSRVPTLRALIEYLGGTVTTVPRDVSPTGRTVATFTAIHRQSGYTVRIEVSGDTAIIHVNGEQQSAMFIAGTGLRRVGGAWLVMPTTFEVLFGVVQG